MTSDELMILAIVGGACFGYGLADLIITMRQKHHISIDALLMWLAASIALGAVMWFKP